MHAKGPSTELPLIFLPADSTLFFSRQDPSDPRLGDLVKVLPPLHDREALSSTVLEVTQTEGPGQHFFVGGYPDDEGIRINRGRAGASQAPDEIRRALYKMTPSLLGLNQVSLWDVGNLNIAELDLSTRHEVVTNAARGVLANGGRWIGLGGGHDYGFADADAFCGWCQDRQIRPLVINFDAHLDVRPTTNGLSSGTPFFRLLEKHTDIDFAEIGIQSQCNSRAHLSWLKERNARILTQEEIEISGVPMVTKVSETLSDWLIRPRPAFISIDIDAFSSSVAPGASQSWATGFMPQDFFPTLSVLISRLDIRMLSIYEVSPPLDHDARTSKLAAQILHRVISA